MMELDGTDVKMVSPYFVCAVAKRQQTHQLFKSKAQILTQIRALQVNRYSNLGLLLIFSNMESRTGALTDGSSWTFWHNHQGEWYMISLNSITNEEAKKVLCK